MSKNTRGKVDAQLKYLGDKIEKSKYLRHCKSVITIRTQDDGGLSQKYTPYANWNGLKGTEGALTQLVSTLHQIYRRTDL